MAEQPISEIGSLTPQLPTKTSKRKVIIALGIIFLLIFLGFAIYFLIFSNQKLNFLPLNQPKSENASQNEKSEINTVCKKIIAAIEESPSRYYFACTDKVFAIEKGKVLKEWGADKLVSLEITSMVKAGNNLYIGNEGVTQIDPNTDNVKRYDRGNGMRYVGNTVLAVDNDILWIGTFGDLYKLDLKTEKLDQITKSVSASNISVEDIKVTPQAVYILTQGAIVRYDKNNNLWEKFDKSVFGIDPGTWSESVGTQLVYINGVVISLQPYANKSYQLWYAKDGINSKWHSMTEVIDLIERDSPSVEGSTSNIMIVGYTDDGSVILKTTFFEDVIHYYVNPSTNEAGLARNKYYDSYTKINPEEKYKDFLNNILLNK